MTAEGRYSWPTWAFLAASIVMFGFAVFYASLSEWSDAVRNFVGSLFLLFYVVSRRLGERRRAQSDTKQLTGHPGESGAEAPSTREQTSEADGDGNGAAP
jgi:hypothetical protein